MLTRAEGSLAGRVLDEKGEPLPGIAVHSWSCSAHARAVTDAEGKFRLEGLVAGEVVRLWAFGVDYGPFGVEDVNPSEGPMTIQFPGPASRKIAGKIVDSNGRPVGADMVLVKGNHFSLTLFADALGRFETTRALSGPCCVEATDRQKNESVTVWEVSPGTEELTVRFPSEEQRKESAAERGARAERAHEIGIPASMAEHAYLRNAANIGPLPVRDSLWMLRGIKWAELKVQIPEEGVYRVIVRGRRVGTDEAPQLCVSAGEQSFMAQMDDYEWKEYRGTLKLEAGELALGFQLQRGWAADLDWVEVRRE